MPGTSGWCDMLHVDLQAVKKFKQGIEIDSSRHDTKWCLGNAYTSQASMLYIRHALPSISHG